MSATTHPPPTDVRAIPAPKFWRRWGIGRTKFYLLVDQGLPILKRGSGTGSRFWVPQPDGDRWMKESFFGENAK